MEFILEILYNSSGYINNIGMILNKEIMSVFDFALFRF